MGKGLVKSQMVTTRSGNMANEKLNKSFLRIRLFELFLGDPRWGKSLGRVVLDVKHPGLKVWFQLSMEFGGFEDAKLYVVD